MVANRQLTSGPLGLAPLAWVQKSPHLPFLLRWTQDCQSSQWQCSQQELSEAQYTHVLARRASEEDHSPERWCLSCLS